ncbi:MAG TPA: hypothetical protein VFU15_02975 [Bacteroidia bacterium]|nr:hypothetical protein [Bacteroidia bacterium]
MFLRAFRSVEKFLKGLPVIRDIPGFNSLPEAITPHNLRFYKLNNLVQTLGMFVHASWILLFAVLHVYTLAYINVLSVAIYIFNIVINRRGYHFTASSIMVTEIAVHQIIAVKFFGLDAGFQYYLIVITLFPFLMPKGKWTLKGILLAGCLTTFILLDYFLKDAQPWETPGSGTLGFIRISNIAMSFISLCISGAYFNLAMHETEADLAKKTSELIEAEKKATLGNVATEMAHEIQNPLNFVNNFSEMNEELLLELKNEMERSGSNEEAIAILNDLLENSKRIKTNGQRVSKIVSLLQDRVNKL